MKLAISGKGGVGKTTIASALIKAFAQRRSTVYAIDADPDACLAAGIGIADEEARKIKPVVEMRDLIRSKSGGGTFYVLNPKLDDAVDEYCYKQGNILFLRMGDVKKGGSECYCRENTFLNALLSSLLLDKDDVVIMDMGAGIEHLTRGTAKGVDMMLVVVEPSKNSINTALRVQQMAGDLGIEKVKVIGNKIGSAKQKEFIEKSFPDGDVLGFIPFNDSLWINAMESQDTVESRRDLLGQIGEVSKMIEKEVGDSGQG